MQQLQSGATLQGGKYIIERVLGQGGFGITYLAQHTTLDKQVAIKEFFPKNYCVRNVSSNEIIVNTNNAELIEKLKKRFLKEARNIAKLDYPGIVKIHDIFEENRTAYYVMDYINGENFSQIVKKNGPLSEEKAIEYIIKVGEALEYMHSKRMTHFDVKPANIILREGTKDPVLIDFGLSKQYNIEGEDTSTLLQAVSNGFSPIELYNVENLSEFSPQSDVYSLGATLLYLLKGQTPPPSVSLVSQEFPKPTEITTPIYEAILKAMASNSSQRCQTIANFIDIIKRTRVKESNLNLPFTYNNDGVPSIKLINKIVDVKIRIGSLLGVGPSVGILCFYFICIIILGFYQMCNYGADLSYNLQLPLNSDPYQMIIWPMTLIIGMITSLLGLWGIYFLSVLKRKGFTLFIVGIIGFILFFIYSTAEYLIDFYRYCPQEILGLIIPALFTILILIPPTYILIKLIRCRSFIRSFLINTCKIDSTWIWNGLIIIIPLLGFIIEYIWNIYHQ